MARVEAAILLTMEERRASHAAKKAAAPKARRKRAAGKEAGEAARSTGRPARGAARGDRSATEDEEMSDDPFTAEQRRAFDEQAEQLEELPVFASDWPAKNTKTLEAAGPEVGRYRHSRRPVCRSRITTAPGRE